LPGTFGIEASRIIFVLAGGMANVALLDAAVEDDIAAARRDVAALGPMERDVVIAVSASGSTPYTLAGAEAAREGGARLIAIANRAASPLLHIADCPIPAGFRPRGAARFDAAGGWHRAKIRARPAFDSRQRAMGHVYRGHMVNLRPDNEKLRRRAVHIVAVCADVDEDRASASLSRAEGKVKCAILMPRAPRRAGSRAI